MVTLILLNHLYVFAPRGNGKTALKRKIELSSNDKDFLCITYNFFNIANKKLSDIDQAYHLENIVRLVVIAIITATQGGQFSKLSKDERHLIYLFVKKYLSKIHQSELKNDIKAIKNFSDTALDIWNKYTGPIGLVINGLLKKIGLDDAEISKFENQEGQLGSQNDQLSTLYKISRKFGYKCIYILIDKIDENTLTNSASNSYRFISALIGDLQLLELEGYAFKFFLWDLLLKEYREVARPDRIKHYELNWDADQLCAMLSERLKAYSKNNVTSLTQLLDTPGSFNLDRFIAYFAQGSPRNVIRICKEILDQ